MKGHMQARAHKRAKRFPLIAAGCIASTLTLSAATKAPGAPEGPATVQNSFPTSKTAATNAAAAEVTVRAPSTPREYFNAGTHELAAGKFREAEAFLESALASQQEELQYAALYNLGHVRFDQGLEELKKNPPPAPAMANGKATGDMADGAIKAADAALASDNVQRMVAAYMHGRGVRKDLKAATAAVEDALKTYSAILAKWQRSSGDFKGAQEIKLADADAEQNAETVDRSIAKLVDSIRKMQQCANGMNEKGRELGDQLKKLKGKIPAPNMPPGAGGEDDEDEDQPMGQKPGQKEGPTKEGKQMTLTPEQAGWLLQGFKLDGNRRLPMGQPETGTPKDRSRATW